MGLGLGLPHFFIPSLLALSIHYLIKDPAASRSAVHVGLFAPHGFVFYVASADAVGEQMFQFVDVDLLQFVLATQFVKVRQVDGDSARAWQVVQNLHVVGVTVLMNGFPVELVIIIPELLEHGVFCLQATLPVQAAAPEVAFKMAQQHIGNFTLEHRLQGVSPGQIWAWFWMTLGVNLICSRLARSMSFRWALSYCWK